MSTVDTILYCDECGVIMGHECDAPKLGERCSYCGSPIPLRPIEQVGRFAFLPLVDSTATGEASARDGARRGDGSPVATAQDAPAPVPSEETPSLNGMQLALVRKMERAAADWADIAMIAGSDCGPKPHTSMFRAVWNTREILDRLERAMLKRTEMPLVARGRMEEIL